MGAVKLYTVEEVTLWIYEGTMYAGHTDCGDSSQWVTGAGVGNHKKGNKRCLVCGEPCPVAGSSELESQYTLERSSRWVNGKSADFLADKWAADWIGMSFWDVDVEIVW